MSAPAVPSAAPAGLSKACYSVFRTSAQTVLHKQELSGTRSSQELRLLRHTLNDFTQAAFLQVRQHLRLPGVMELEDATLEATLTKAEQDYKSSRIALQIEMDQCAALLTKAIQAPLPPSSLEHDLPDPIISTGVIATQAQRERLKAHEKQFQTVLTKLNHTIPEILKTEAQHAEYLATATSKSSSSSSSSVAPLSAEVRTILTRLNKDLAASSKASKSKSSTSSAVAPQPLTKKGRKSKEPVAAAEAESVGKATKSPGRRLSARNAAKPY